MPTSFSTCFGPVSVPATEICVPSARVPRRPITLRYSGLSRSVSNLGSAMGTAIAGTILVAQASAGNRAYAQAMACLGVIGLIGLAAALFLPAEVKAPTESDPVPSAA